MWARVRSKVRASCLSSTQASRGNRRRGPPPRVRKEWRAGSASLPRGGEDPLAHPIQQGAQDRPTQATRSPGAYRSRPRTQVATRTPTWMRRLQVFQKRSLLPQPGTETANEEKCEKRVPTPTMVVPCVLSHREVRLGCKPRHLQKLNKCPQSTDRTRSRQWL